MYLYSLWQVVVYNINNPEKDTKRNITIFVFGSAIIHMVVRLWYSGKENVLVLINNINKMNKILGIRANVRMSKTLYAIIFYMGIHCVYLAISITNSFNIYGFFHAYGLIANTTASYIEAHMINRIVRKIIVQADMVNDKLLSHYKLISQKRVTISKIEEIRCIANVTALHYKVTNIAKLANDTFGIPVMMTFFSNSTSVTADIHFVFVIILNKFRSGYYDFGSMSNVYLILSILWILGHSVHFLFLIKPWTDLTLQVSNPVTDYFNLFGFFHAFSLIWNITASYVEAHMMNRIVQKLINIIEVVNDKLLYSYESLGQQNMTTSKLEEIRLMSNTTALHYKLMEIAQFGNTIFGVIILMGFFSNCIATTADIHDMFLVICRDLKQTGNIYGSLSKPFLILGAAWILGHVIHFVFLINSWAILAIKVSQFYF
ncbi:hypothetical protein FQR65_LT04269 [Abscondita terminalis]|nr:hypothetical protein FQR65_LT04269 [Abscondita terminalis]